MLEIGRVVVVETNHNASALFFDIGNQHRPSFYQTTAYDRPRMLDKCTERAPHRGSWEWRFKNLITDHA